MSDIEIDKKIKELEEILHNEKNKTGLPSLSSKISKEDLDELYEEKKKRRDEFIDDVIDDLNSNGY